LDLVVGWAREPGSVEARRYAERHALPFVALEKGLLGSFRAGGGPALSVLLDEKGAYYDSTRASQLESLLASSTDDNPLDDARLLKRSADCIRRITAAGLSQCNDSPVADGVRRVPGLEGGRYVLVVDQPCLDPLVTKGSVDQEQFRALIETALSEHPDAQVLVETSGAAGKGYVQGVRDSRVRVVKPGGNPIRLLELVDHVYVATSHIGFEALMVGKPVTCVGVPFYAGWGLTDDRVPTPRRAAVRSLEQVFAAAYLLLSRYVDPESGERTEIERVIEHLETQRRLFAQNTGTLFCFGFRVWKYDFVRRYLRSPGNRVVFVRTARQAKRKGFDRDSKLVVWGARCADATQALSEEFGTPIWKMEDGFLRSVGLGSDRAAPASLVLDRSGVYYDPRSPSDLESILSQGEFSSRELERAARLREEIVSSEVSKYNIDGGEPIHATPRPGQRVILVPGQVADDASVVLGSPVVRSNTELLRQVRRNRPDAYVIYKPHPDVVSGNRAGVVQPDDVASLCDEMVVDAGIGRCLAVADELHTMTSLVGFEALLRGKQVVVYGQPFYAGWGLTDDQNPPARRGRKRTLDELVAATLVRYPRYVNHETGEFTQPERVVAEIERARPTPGQITLKRSWTDKTRRRVVKGMSTVRQFIAAAARPDSEG